MSIRLSDEPSRRAVVRGLAMSSSTIRPTVMVAPARARLTPRRAFSTSPWASRIEAMTEHPMPSISPKPITDIMGAQMMLTAATPAGPTP